MTKFISLLKEILYDLALFAGYHRITKQDGHKEWMNEQAYHDYINFLLQDYTQPQEPAHRCSEALQERLRQRDEERVRQYVYYINQETGLLEYCDETKVDFDRTLDGKVFFNAGEAILYGMGYRKEKEGGGL